MLAGQTNWETRTAGSLELQWKWDSDWAVMLAELRWMDSQRAGKWG
jgi:hypothetical protein